jgi:hypothetical protein
MSADQIRMVYSANHGNREQFEHFRQRVEMHAIQRGTAWQVETWKQHALLTVYLRTGDVGGLKECVQQLKRLSVEVPSLEGALIAARSAYQVLRGTPSLALSTLEDEAIRSELQGMGRRAGVHARACNALGQHARAKQVCLKALTRLDPGDPALVARHERLARVVNMLKQRPPEQNELSPVNSGPPRLMTVVHLLQHGGEHTLTGSAQWALKQLTELTESDAAFLFVPRGQSVRCVASIGDAEPSEDITRFVATRLASLQTVDDDAEDETIATDAIVDLMRFEAQGKVFQLNGPVIGVERSDR